jgi:hypothetical protein
MPFLMLVQSRRPQGPSGPPGAPRPWQPNWRVWRWLVAAVVVGYAASESDGAVAALLVFTVVALCCRAITEALPYHEGLREWRQ